MRFSPGSFLDVLFSLGNIHSISSKLPSTDVESVLSVLIFPPITLALVCNALSSPLCPPTIIITCALATVPFPFAIACISYILGEINVWLMVVPLPCVPSPKSRSISRIFPVLLAVNVAVNGALHLDIRISMERFIDELCPPTWQKITSKLVSSTF